MKIAIIGGGISGVAVAWHLKDSGHEVHIYERRPKIGGDCESAHVRIGSVERWSDLGVNDFNAATYKRVVAVMDELGFEYRDLEDTACFYTADGDLVYTIDGEYDTAMPPDLRKEFERFRKSAGDFVRNAHMYEGWTVEHYLQQKGFSPDFAAGCIYPRINAMYFVHDKGPGSMPIEAVMHYYVLQEGFGTGVPAERKYFVGGTETWIRALSRACGASALITGQEVGISAFPDHVTVHQKEGDVDYDRVVFACHALNARESFKEGLTDEVATVLGSFTYLDSTAVAHTWAGLLPRAHNAWRTYNVLIRPEGAPPTPYSMTYVENRHQNDHRNPEYDHYGGPQWFVTLNPQLPIPDSFVLTDARTGQPAVAHFPHNVVDFAALSAQQHLPPLQGRNNVYFAGGWTLGAGLHEECWEAAVRVADMLLGRETDTEHLYHIGPEGLRRAPHYMRSAVGQE